VSSVSAVTFCRDCADDRDQRSAVCDPGVETDLPTMATACTSLLRLSRLQPLLREVVRQRLC
jgi:hypothetical protein